MPSISGMLQRNNYYVILDKDIDHPRKPYFDLVVFELLKDNPAQHEIRYKDQPLFLGLVLFDHEPGKEEWIPFKFWKRKPNAETQEQALIILDPTDVRLFVLNAQFIIVGNHMNQPQGYGLENYQVIETATHEVQKSQMDEYLVSLQPVYEYLNNLQYNAIRNYLFCHSCQREKRYTLLDETTRYKNQAFFVCRDCAGKELIANLKQRLDITPPIKLYLRDLLKKYRDVVKTLNVFNPNFDILAHPEATLVGIKKNTIHTEIHPQSIYNFEIPDPLMKYFENSHRVWLLPVQIMALEQGLLENQSELIVSATSSGKTMIGELAGISKILRNKMGNLLQQGISSPFQPFSLLVRGETSSVEDKMEITKEQQEYCQRLTQITSSSRLLYIVPIVALANMRYREYKLLKSFGITVALKIGVSHLSDRSQGSMRKEFGNFLSADIIVATYEAIDIILRSGHPYLLQNVRTIMIDEIQMLADAERGYILDGLIARLRLYLPHAQMLYMSATVMDPQDLAHHLRTALILYNERPVPIERHLVLCLEEKHKLHHLRNLVRSEFKNRSSFNFSGQTIVFTNSRKNTERLAEYLTENHIKAYAYHGGLEYSQRKFIEKSFELQKVAAVVTTAALAAGVDFPASMVIFYSLFMGIKELSVAEFEQMGGRAGRLKKHDMGKVYMLVLPGKSGNGLESQTEEQLALKLLSGKIEPLHLESNQDAQYLQILCVIAMYSLGDNQDHGISKADVAYYHSLLYNGEFDLTTALKYLKDQQLIRSVYNNAEWRATRFGKSVAESFFSLENALKIRDTLLQPISLEMPAPNILKLAQSLHQFNNVYVTNRMLAELSLKNERVMRSNNLFSNSVLSMIKAEHLGKKTTHINRRVLNTILKWTQEIFNCTCSDKPYCDCGRKQVENIIVTLRTDSLTLSEIIEELREEYEIKIFLGDLVDYFEALIYSLFSIAKIGRSLAIPAKTMLKLREIPKLVNQLIGEKGKKSLKSEQENQELESETIDDIDAENSDEE